MNDLSEYVPFLLLTSPRSGTHMLRSALLNHPAVVMYGEMFNQQAAAYLPYPLGEHPRSIIHRHIYHPFPREIRAVGFPLHDYQAFHRPNPYWSDLYPVLSELPGLRIIRLTRDNLAEKFVSNIIAMRTNVWWLYNQKPNQDGALKVRVPAEKFAEYFQRYAAESAKADAAVAGREVCRITYTQLVDDFSATIQRTLAFLKLPQMPLEPATQRQNRRSLRDTLENYDQVAAYFADTPYAVFFNHESAG